MMSVWKAIGGCFSFWARILIEGACEKEGFALGRWKEFKCKGAFLFLLLDVTWWACLSRFVGNEGPGALRSEAAVGID